MIWNLPGSESYCKTTFMEEFCFSSLPGHPGLARPGKAAPRIDMTPMVDLGFLLISFFIFTTEISQPAATNLYMPHSGDSTRISDSRSLTVLLSGNGRIFYYFGTMEKAITDNQILPTNYSGKNGLGSIIRKMQGDLRMKGINPKELTICIKPEPASTFRDLVAALDEMLINGVNRYAVVDPENEEKAR